MKLSTVLTFILFASSINLYAQQSVNKIVERRYVERLLNTLASDEMGGRHALSPHIHLAADFIADEFRAIGLKPYAEESFRQTFHMVKITRENTEIRTNGKALSPDDFLVISNQDHIEWNQNSKVNIKYIKKEDDFASSFRALVQGHEDVIVLVDPSFASFIKRFNRIYSRENIVGSIPEKGFTKVFILAEEIPADFIVKCKNSMDKVELFNVAAVIPGKSKANEYVVFSAHYDHIGILNGNAQDSIANGADDDASGTSAMISLAKYYKNLDNNERTLIFVAFTAEEIGMYGSKYFSNNINPDSVIAMINIEMIGKDSKFGPKTLYLTGYERSNLGELMQKNLANTDFKFHADPYPQQNLFYRSDNAVLAALGVPAHTFSTSQIDKDTFYHTVKDEVSTLDLDNIVSSIEAIALGAEGIVNGRQTPSRVEKLKD